MSEQQHDLPDTERTDVMDTTITQSADTWRHPINTGHLVMGIAFAGLVTVWAMVTGDVVDNDAVRWLLPIPWVLAGAIGLAAATVANLRTRKAREGGN